MKNHLSLALFLLPISSISVAQDAADVRRQIEASEAQVGKAIATKDVATLRKLWAPKMLVNSPANKVLTREDVIAALGKEQLNYSRYENKVEAFTAIDDDLAVLMGHEVVVRADGAYEGRTLYRRYTNVWRRTPAGWVQIARQATYTSEAQPDLQGSGSASKPSRP